MSVCRALCVGAGLALVGLQTAVAADGPVPVFQEAFETGAVTGRVGKAGKSLSMDGRGVVNMERGTIAYFYQSATEPRETEWNNLGGIAGETDAGYWRSIMRFQFRRQEFLFNLFDVGFYSPPLAFQSPFGRWKAGEWHHLAAVWDRQQGVTIYEDGKRVNSNWGRHRWEWNYSPVTFSLGGPLDEAMVFADCLSDAQIAQLANGGKATGPAMPPLPPDSARPGELARMGWTGEDLAALPVVTAGQPQVITFARINRCVDAKRPVAYPFEGLWQTTWPSLKYGPSIRGQRLDIALDAGSSYDHIRLFVHRPFTGELAHAPKGQDETILAIEAPQSMFWHRRLPAACTDTDLVLKRTFGQLGQIDLYRVDPLDAARLPATTETYLLAATNAFPATEPGRVVMGETPRHLWNPVHATKGDVGAWSLETPAFGGFQALTGEPADAKAFDGVQVNLVVEGLTEATPVHIEVKEPVLTDRVWLAADAVLKPAGSGRQVFTLLLKGRPVINLPPMQARQKPAKGKGKTPGALIPVPGVGFTVMVTAANPVKWIMGQGGTQVKFAVTDMAAALPTAIDDQVEWMREAYAETMEGHRYSWKRIQLPLRWLALFAPGRMEFRQMWERVDEQRPDLVGIDVKPIVYIEPANDTGAPAWAFWQKVVMDLHRKAVLGIIDRQQVWTGELGGVWNDDSDHIENWIDYLLCLDGQGRIHDAVVRYWNGVYNYQLIDGVGKYTQDTCHYSEEGSSSLGMRLLVDYGDPVAYARTMAAVSRMKTWVNPDPKGGYLFKSGWVGPEGAWTEGAFLLNKKPTGHVTDVLVPLGYLVWYNRHPQAVDYVRGLQPGMQFLSSAYDRVTDWNAARARYAAKLASKDKAETGAVMLWVNETGVPDAVRQAYAQEYKPLGRIDHYLGYKDTDKHWLAWKMTGDIRFLVDSYKRTAEWFYSHDWLNTEARPSMDRNPLPRTSLTRARLGAIAANRGSSGNAWPLHAVSYVRGGDDVAALVTVNEENRFAVRFYPFTASAQEMQIRAWRCNGTFKVTLAGDKNDDGIPEETIWEQEMTLDRGADIRFTLPPAQGSILMVSPIRTEVPNYDRPDPAISLNSIELVYGDQLVVRVYNNGTRPVEDVLVRVRDGRSGEIIPGGEQHTGPIEAPLDLKPRLKTTEFKNVNANSYGRLLIEIDPDKTIDDFNRHNNTVSLDYRATFTLDDGWK
jgi:hypothetical protein